MAHGQCASPAARSLSLRLLSHDLEAFGAAVFGMSPEGVLPCETSIACLAPVVPRFDVHTLLVPYEVSPPHEGPSAALGLADVRVGPLGIVRLHVRLVVVAALEQLAALVAFVVGVGLRRCAPRPRSCGASVNLSLLTLRHDVLQFA